MAPRDDPWPGDRQEVFRLRSETTTIGSDPGCDIVLEGLEPVQARGAARRGRRVRPGPRRGPSRGHPGERCAGRPLAAADRLARRGGPLDDDASSARSSPTTAVRTAVVSAARSGTSGRSRSDPSDAGAGPRTRRARDTTRAGLRPGGGGLRLRRPSPRPGARRCRARRPGDDPAPRHLRRGGHPGARRRARPGHAARGAGGLPGGVLPRALAGLQGLRAARRRGRDRLRGGRGRGRRRADRLPRRPGQRVRRPVEAPAQPPGGREPARCRRRAGHRAARRDHRRQRRHLLGDHPAARRPPARHGHAALGAHPHAADRGRRRGPLPRRGARRRAARPAPSTRSAGRRCCATPTCCSGWRRSSTVRCRSCRCRCSRPGLSSRWLSLVTDVDTQAGRSLVDSMANEVVVQDDSHPRGRPLRADGLRRRGAGRARGAGERLDDAAAPRLPVGPRAGPGRGSAADADHPRGARRATRRPRCVVRRRRRVVAGVSVLGTGLLGLSLSTKPDSRQFYGLTAAVAGDLDGRRAAVRAAAPRLDRGPGPAAAPTGRHPGGDRGRGLRLLLRLRARRPQRPGPRPARSAGC